MSSLCYDIIVLTSTAVLQYKFISMAAFLSTCSQRTLDLSTDQLRHDELYTVHTMGTTVITRATSKRTCVIIQSTVHREHEIY